MSGGGKGGEGWCRSSMPTRIDTLLSNTRRRPGERSLREQLTNQSVRRNGYDRAERRPGNEARFIDPRPEGAQRWRGEGRR